jgi:hypothetical protein
VAALELRRGPHVKDKQGARVEARSQPSGGHDAGLVRHGRLPCQRRLPVHGALQAGSDAPFSSSGQRQQERCRNLQHEQQGERQARDEPGTKEIRCTRATPTQHHGPRTRPTAPKQQGKKLAGRTDAHHAAASGRNAGVTASRD